MKKHPSNTLKVRLAIAIPTLIWGSSYVMIRLCLQETTPYPPGYSACSMALFRSLVASLAISIPYLLIPFKRAIRYQDYPRLLFNGILGVGLYSTLINSGEEHADASIASFIVSMMPLFIMILSIFFLGERLIPLHFGFATLSLLGLGIIAWGNREEGGALEGIPALLLATLVGACFSILQKKSLQHYHPCQVLAFATWGGTLPLMPFIPTTLEEFQAASYPATFSIVYLGIFSSAIAFTVFAYALAHQSPAQLGPYMYLTPIVTTVLECLWNHKLPSPSTLLGEGLALIGVILIQWDKKSRSQKSVRRHLKS